MSQIKDLELDSAYIIVHGKDGETIINGLFEINNVKTSLPNEIKEGFYSETVIDSEVIKKTYHNVFVSDAYGNWLFSRIKFESHTSMASVVVRDERWQVPFSDAVNDIKKEVYISFSMTSGKQFTCFLFDTTVDILAKTSFDDYLKGEKKSSNKKRELFDHVYPPDFVSEGILTTREEFLRDYFHYVYPNYYASSSGQSVSINQYASKTFDEQNVQYLPNEARVEMSTKRSKAVVESIVNNVFKSESDMNTFLLSEDIRSSSGILVPRFATSATSVINKKQWLKWMFDTLTDSALLASLPPFGIDYASDLLREAIIQLNRLKVSGPSPNPLEVVINQENYADAAEALAGSNILNILNGLFGHKTIRGVFMHTFTYYGTYNGFVLDSTTLRPRTEMEKLFKLYEFIFPGYQTGFSWAPNGATPSGVTISSNIFHYLYGNAYFRFSVVGSSRQYKFNLGYAPMTFLESSKIDLLSLSSLDKDLQNKFIGYYNQEYDKKLNENERVKAFLDNSQELFKILEPKIRIVLKYLQYDERLVKDIMFKVISSLQAKSKTSVRTQIDDLMTSPKSGGIITFNNIKIGSEKLKIYLDKSEDLAGHDIFTFIRDWSETKIITEEMIELINREAIHGKMSVLWSTLESYYIRGAQQNVRFKYVENKVIQKPSVIPNGWQYIGLSPSAARYDFIEQSERYSMGNPSYIEISLDGLFRNDINEMLKLLKVVEISTGMKKSNINTQFGFVMSIINFGAGFTFEDHIAIFDGRMFHEPSEVYSGSISLGAGIKYMHIDLATLNQMASNDLDIERINEEWDIPFLYSDLSKY
ncbi:hypothetical protein LCGC14_0886250 [marine sediment metagenome]|uniref:Uncharacterized protein n=1 Tax=marine sediment metagenome TaxID=412755 RepID=A0A0F9RK26_9ZZZZ|nr:hypothetical protein [bacterium]